MKVFESFEEGEEGKILSPENPVEEQSVEKLVDMAKSLTHDQITELDEYAQKNFSNYRKILS